MGKYFDEWEYSKNCRPGMQPKNYAPEKGVVSIEDVTRENFFAQIIDGQGTKTYVFQGSNEPIDFKYDLSIKTIREGNTISNGMYDAWHFFKSYIDADVRQYLSTCVINDSIPDIKVIGHSLGGGLGTCCARHIGKNVKAPCRGVVFGALNIGNKQFADEFELLPVDFTQVENGLDGACLWPPEVMGFKRVGKRVHIRQQWWKNLLPAVYMVADHLSYEKDLKRTNM